MIESNQEYRQDVVLGLLFLGIAVFSGHRVKIYFDPKGSGRVIMTFYLLIFLASSIRAVWFLIPSSFLESTYSPAPLMAFTSAGWFGCFVSEVFEAFGSILIYSVFILVISYWSHMLKKVGSDSIDLGKLSGKTRIMSQSSYPISIFVSITAGIILLEIVNIVLYLFQVYSAVHMIAFDNILIAMVSFATFAMMTTYSYKIRAVLLTINSINITQSRLQINRIVAITVVANIFFLFRVVLDTVCAIGIFYMLRDRSSVKSPSSELIPASVWDAYICAKHGSEIAVLGLELIISSAIKTYDISSTRNLRSQRAVSSQAVVRVTEQRQKETIKVTEKTPLIAQQTTKTSKSTVSTTSTRGGMLPEAMRNYLNSKHMDHSEIASEELLESSPSSKKVFRGSFDLERADYDDNISNNSNDGSSNSSNNSGNSSNGSSRSSRSSSSSNSRYGSQDECSTSSDQSDRSNQSSGRQQQSQQYNNNLSGLMNTAKDGRNFPVLSAIRQYFSSESKEALSDSNDSDAHTNRRNANEMYI